MDNRTEAQETQTDIERILAGGDENKMQRIVSLMKRHNDKFASLMKNIATTSISP